MANPPKPPPVPVKLELAELPREQIGPFLLLGVDKTAPQDEVEANWARRVILARKKQIKTPLEDINWAREAISERDKRVLADSSSLNADTTAGTLRQLTQEYASAGGTGCRPVDVEKDLSGFTPAVDIPDQEQIRQAIQLPDIPCEFPAVRKLLETMAVEPIDPWELGLAE
jgi:hypothetical protein